MRRLLALFTFFAALGARANAGPIWFVAENAFDSSSPQDAWESPTVFCLALQIGADRVQQSLADNSTPSADMQGRSDIRAGTRVERLGLSSIRCNGLSEATTLARVRVRDGRSRLNGRTVYIIPKDLTRN